MGSKRSHTTVHGGLGKVRQARAVVMILLVLVAFAIVFIDKPQQELMDLSQDTPEISIDKVAEGASFYEATLSSTNNEAVDSQSQAADSQPQVTDSQPVDIVAQSKAVEASKAVAKKPQIITPMRNISSESEIVTLQPQEKSPVFAQAKQPAFSAPKKLKRTSPKCKRNGTKSRVHRVVAGESFSSIAKKYFGREALGVALYHANRNIVSNPRKLQTGQLITVPNLDVHKPAHRKARVVRKSTKRYRAPKSVTKSRRGKFYIVSKGESLSSIAKKNGIKFLTLYDLNRDMLSYNPNFIRAGAKIRISY